MEYLKKYGYYAVVLLLVWLSDTYLSERSSRQMWGFLFLAGVVYTIFRMVRSRKKYRCCPKCGWETKLGK